MHHELNEHDVQEEPADVTHETTNLDGESVQTAINARLGRTTRLTFFDDESGDDEMHIEPDDYNMVTGLVDKRGLPEFSKATKFAGAWMGMVFKRGSSGLGYYRDCFRMDISLAALLPALADATPILRGRQQRAQGR